MKLTVIGCCGAFPSHGKGTTSYLLQSGDFNLVIDLGSTAFVELEKHINPFAVDAMIISHYHHDHIADVGVFQYYRQLKPYPYEGEKPIIPIYGHTQTPLHFKELTLSGVSEGRGYHEDETLDLGPFQITFMRTLHPVPTYAMRIVEKATGKILVFTADSGYLEEFNEFARDANLFLADTYFLNGNERNKTHLTAQETGKIGKAANVQKIVATHLAEGVDREMLRYQIEEASQHQIPVEIAQSGMTYEI